MTFNNTFLNLLGQEYDYNFFCNSIALNKEQLDKEGILVLNDFLSVDALNLMRREALSLKHKAYRTQSEYNIYVLPEDLNLPSTSVRNRRFISSKACIADDLIPANSSLRTIYESELFKKWICQLQELDCVFPYADNLSSININYYKAGDALDWHFDNSDFTITLLIQQCEKGGEYEYYPNMRYNENGEEDYKTAEKCLDGLIKPECNLSREGTLMIFRGNQSLHRVCPVLKGERILITFNYNAKSGIALSEQSRKTFFGRIN